MTTFPRNTWYVACSSEELGAKPLGRKICNESMAFYRGEGGVPYALEDFCPHRGAPLSLGTVCGNQLQCGYHGLEMGCDGKVVAMPGQRVRGFPAIKRFATVEKYGFIWVWAGDADAADITTLPQFEFFDNPNWAYGGGLYHINCDYRLMVDNLMDLTHETYVHAGSIGRRPRHHQPPHERHPRAAVLGHGDAGAGAGRHRLGGPLADLPLHPAVTHHDRSGRGLGG
jgi:vanillate monooxygenase